MRIRTENYRAYVVDCACGERFEDDGGRGVITCPACGAVDDALSLVEQWWSAVGWTVESMIALAPRGQDGAANLPRAHSRKTNAETEKAA